MSDPHEQETPGRSHGGLAARLHDETFSGAVLLGAALVALLWANSPWREAYQSLAGLVVGPDALLFSLSLSRWAAVVLLAIFFCVVGLELKTEVVTGSLRDMKEAMLPMIAAALGMLFPALIYAGVQLVTDSGGMQGWAIPTATDIAFALALLGLFGRGLPARLRVFLMTLAVVDDLLAITIIAIFYTEDISVGMLAVALGFIVLFCVLVQRRVDRWWMLIPIALVAWGFMHASGVHATVAGVLLGLSVPAMARRDEHEGMTDRFTTRLQPWSAGLALPVFAFFAAGVSVVDSGGIGSLLADPIAIGVMAGLVLGKPLGIWGGVAILVRTTKLQLGEGVQSADVLGVTMLAGIGFTVSLLIANLSFGSTTEGDHASFAVLLASFISAVLGAATLRLRARARRRAGQLEGDSPGGDQPGH